jgi:hypothetical protein
VCVCVSVCRELKCIMSMHVMYNIIHVKKKKLNLFVKKIRSEFYVRGCLIES